MSTLAAAESDERHGQVLIGIMNAWADFEILRERLWYRIPVASCPHPWPPDWLAIYHTKAFGADRYSVQYYGHVRRIERKVRRELLPEEPLNLKSDREYFQVHLHSLERLPTPIVSPRPRRNPFILTTWRKFKEAGQINDLFDESPLEDRLWDELKVRRIPAERQWRVEVEDKRYYLDFALFCNKGDIDVETDGSTWHKERSKEDNERNNAVESAGWKVLRFDTEQIRETAGSYCISTIESTINRLGGLKEEPWASRRFFDLPEGPAQQLTLFEEQSSYDLDLD